MKYCRICKTAAKETDTTCAKGHPLTVFGAKSAGPGASGSVTSGPQRAKPTTAGPSSGAATPSASPASAPAMFTIQGQVRELEEVRRRNVTVGRGLGLLSLLAVLAIAFILYQVYARSVLDYAVLENIRIEQDDVAESRITVKFDVKTPGKIVFDRRSGAGRTEKIDVIEKAEPRTMTWSWPSDPKTGIDFDVVYRGGWLLDSERRHFNVTRAKLGVEVVFLMDSTSSMKPYIDGLKRQCIEFSDKIRTQDVDCRLGLVGFGDLEMGEPIRVFPPTEDVARFQQDVARVTTSDGGDLPESGVEALEKALAVRFRAHTRVCFVHITDADCHHPERIPAIAEALKDKGIITFVVSMRQFRDRYEPICVNGGSFHAIRDASFEEILKDVADSITSQIRSN